MVYYKIRRRYSYSVKGWLSLLGRSGAGPFCVCYGNEPADWRVLSFSIP